MDLKSLSQIDIKNLQNIDFGKLKDQIQKRPDILVNILLIPITLFAIIYIYTGQQKKANSLRYKITELKQKVDAVKHRDDTQKEYDEFVKKFPESLPGDKLIDKLSDLAVSYNVQVSSFSPTKEKTAGSVKITSVTINIVADSYADIVQFVKAIESSAYTLRISKWYAILDERRTILRNQQTEETPVTTLNVELEIESLEIKAS